MSKNKVADDKKEEEEVVEEEVIEEEKEASEDSEDTKDKDKEKEPDEEDPKLTVARLEAELKGFKEGASVSAEKKQEHARPAVTTEALLALSEEDRTKLEEQTGRTFNTMLAQVSATERRQETAKREALEARIAVNDAIDSAVEKDPRVSRYRSGIREYFEDVSASDKLDEAKMKRHMDRAVVFARGKMADAAPRVARREEDKLKGGKVDRKNQKPTDDEEEDVNEEDASDKEVPYGTTRFSDDVKISLERKVPKERMKERRKGARTSESVIFDKPDEKPHF